MEINGLVNKLLMSTNLDINQAFIIVNIIHVIIVAGLFFVIGSMKDMTPSWIIIVLAMISLLLPIITGLPNMKIMSIRTYIRILHIFISIALIVFSIAFFKNRKNISQELYSSFTGIALVVFVYHAYKIILRVQKL